MYRVIETCSNLLSNAGESVRPVFERTLEENNPLRRSSKPEALSIIPHHYENLHRDHSGLHAGH